MDDDSSTHNRRTRRSQVLMTASIEFSGSSLPVKLRNLSTDGALIEGSSIPVEGSVVLFRKAELSLSGRIAWVEGSRAGIAFAELLSPDLVLRHIPTPRARVVPDFRRPGLAATRLSSSDRKFGEEFVWGNRPRTSD